ncbi:MAG: hypothetical protein IJX53_05105 [Clostridia bacterium]|nr:hypothetical protein [Clostridia bacterium]
MNGIEKITEKILAEAKAAEQAALEQAAEKAADILADGEEKAEAIRERIEEKAAREGESIVSRAKSAAAMNRRSIDLAVRGELIDEVFEQAFTQIAELPTEEYRAMLCRMLCDAVLEQQRTAEESRALHGDEVEMVEAYEVVLNDADHYAIGQSLVDETRRALQGRIDPLEVRKLVLSSKTAKMRGGVILRYGDVETNCSLETIFAQTRAAREAEVCRILFD